MATKEPNTAAVIFGVIVFLVLWVAALGWLTMLALGALGAVFEIPRLYISYGQGIVVAVCLTFIAGFFRRPARS